MSEQTTFNEFQAGKIEALEVLEQFLVTQEKRGRQFWTTEQIYGVIKSLRLNLQEKFT